MSPVQEGNDESQARPWINSAGLSWPIPWNGLRQYLPISPTLGLPRWSGQRGNALTPNYSKRLHLENEGKELAHKKDVRGDNGQTKTQGSQIQSKALAIEDSMQISQQSDCAIVH